MLDSRRFLSNHPAIHPFSLMNDRLTQPSFSRARLSAAPMSLCLAVLLPTIAANGQETQPDQPIETVEKIDTPATPEIAPEITPEVPAVVPPVDEALPPLVEPLPSPTGDGVTSLPPLDGSIPLLPTSEPLPLEPDPTLSPLEDSTSILESAEDFSSTFEGDAFGGLPTAPSGFLGNGFGSLGNFGGESGSLGAGLSEGRLRKGLSATANLSGTYNSNVNPNGGKGSGNSEGESDFIMALGGSLSYLSTAPRLTFGGSYRGNYSQYFSETDLSGYSQSGSLVANYKSGRVYASATVGLAYDRGSNRYYNSEYVGRYSLTTGLNVRYTVSPKTTIQGTMSTGFSTTDEGGFDDTGSFDAGLSGLYRYSSKTEFGPGIHYGYQEGHGGNNARSSVGPTFTTNYKVNTRLSVNSQVGVDFSSYEDGDSTDVSMTGSLALRYSPSSRWGTSLSIYRGVQPDAANSGGYIDTTAISLGYNRQILRASWNVGVSYNFDSSDDGGGAIDDHDDSGGSWSLNTSLGMGIFANRAQASIFASYSDQKGRGSSNSFTSTSVGFSVSKSF
jgi:hypothetical protein